MPTEITSLRAFLEHTRDMMAAMPNRSSEAPYSSLYDFVLREGMACTFTGKLRPPGIEKMPDHECFANAYALASAEPERFAYVEGFACGLIPLAHAWVIDMDGNVVDPTWAEKDTREFLGVPLCLGYVNRIILAREKYGVLDNWEGGWPILTGEHGPELYRDERFPREGE
jgi:hypothetical protein